LEELATSLPLNQTPKFPTNNWENQEELLVLSTVKFNLSSILKASWNLIIYAP
jgi:hypothetical protein